MNRDRLNERCIALFNRPEIVKLGWFPGLFWEVGKQQLVATTPERLWRPRVDLFELELLLSMSAGEPSQVIDQLSHHAPERVEAITHGVATGVRPWLRRPGSPVDGG